MVNFKIIPIEIAFYATIIRTILILNILGMYLAKISDESIIRYGFKILIVGIITKALCVTRSILLGRKGSSIELLNINIRETIYLYIMGLLNIN